MPRLSSFRSSVFASLVVFAATGCGTEYDTQKVKTYRLAVVNGDAAMQREFKSLIQDYNRYAGETVLEFEANAADANSAIVVTEGLKSRDGKVGWGQWMSESETESGLGKLPGERAKRTIKYSMRVEFDAEYLRRGDQYANQKLFFHEVGHGLEMDHNPNDVRDVMYPDVAGDKNFDAYFARVRGYMLDRK